MERANDLVLPYSECRDMIYEGDVLLFRNPPFPSPGWWIARYSGGMHSHVGVAHWDDDRLKCVEFREFKGARSVTLSSQVRFNPDRIDVFRPLKEICVPTVEEVSDYKYNVQWHRKVFGENRANQVTSFMDSLTGLPYGWKIIWKIVVSYLPFGRLARKNMKDDDVSKINVCSTAVALAFRKFYADPVPYLADSSTKPSDLARSPLFQYIFTIGDVE